MSHHLKVLLEAGIINMRREGTKNFYYIDFDDTTVKPVILFWQQVEPMLKNVVKKVKRGYKMSVYSIYFSPTNSTKGIVNLVAGEIGNFEELDLSKNEELNKVFNSDDICVIK